MAATHQVTPEQRDKTANKSNDKGGTFFLLTDQHHVVAPHYFWQHIYLVFYIIFHTVFQFFEQMVVIKQSRAHVSR